MRLETWGVSRGPFSAQVGPRVSFLVPLCSCGFYNWGRNGDHFLGSEREGGKPTLWLGWAEWCVHICDHGTVLHP